MDSVDMGSAPKVLPHPQAVTHQTQSLWGRFSILEGCKLVGYEESRRQRMEEGVYSFCICGRFSTQCFFAVSPPVCLRSWQSCESLRYIMTPDNVSRLRVYPLSIFFSFLSGDSARVGSPRSTHFFFTKKLSQCRPVSCPLYFVSPNNIYISLCFF